jgi:tetrahydromethanopterin S-methyltransferase subunit G
MAVSARLSRSLHRVLGDEGADDLVNWMVRVEANRSELNDVMSGWRVATEAKFATIDARFDAVDQRFAAVDQRFDAVDQRFDAVDQRFDAVDKRFDAVDQRFVAVDQRFNAVDRRLEGIERRLENIDNKMTDMFKWSFVFWLGSVGVFAGLVRLMK